MNLDDLIPEGMREAMEARRRMLENAPRWYNDDGKDMTLAEDVCTVAAVRLLAAAFVTLRSGEPLDELLSCYVVGAEALTRGDFLVAAESAADVGTVNKNLRNSDAGVPPYVYAARRVSDLMVMQQMSEIMRDGELQIDQLAPLEPLGLG